MEKESNGNKEAPEGKANNGTASSAALKPGAHRVTGGIPAAKERRAPGTAATLPGAFHSSNSTRSLREDAKSSRRAQLAEVRSGSVKCLVERPETAQVTTPSSMTRTYGSSPSLSSLRKDNNSSKTKKATSASDRLGNFRAANRANTKISPVRRQFSPVRRFSNASVASSANNSTSNHSLGSASTAKSRLSLGDQSDGKMPAKKLPATISATVITADVQPGVVRATGGTREGKASRSSAATVPATISSATATTEAAVKPGAVRATGGRREGKPARAAAAAAVMPGAVQATGGSREGKPARTSAPAAAAAVKPGAVQATGGIREGKSGRTPATAPMKRSGSNRSLGDEEEEAVVTAPSGDRKMAPAVKPGAVQATGGSRDGKPARISRTAVAPGATSASDARPGAVSASGGDRVAKRSGPARASAPGAVSSSSPAPQGKPKRGGPDLMANRRTLEDVEEQAQVTTAAGEPDMKPGATPEEGATSAQLKRSASDRSLVEVEEQAPPAVKRSGSNRSLSSASSIGSLDVEEEALVTVPNPPATVEDAIMPGAIQKQYSGDSMDNSKPKKDLMNDSSKAGTYAQLPMPDGTAKDQAKLKAGTYAQIPEDSAPFLIEAKLVDESARVSVYLAEEHDPDEGNPKRIRRIAAGVLCCVAVAVAVVLSVVLTYDFGTEVTYAWEDDDTDYAKLQEECLANTTAEECEANCAGIHGVDLYLADKCCAYAGRSASILAFEEDSLWVPRLEEFYKCTGATIRLEYLPEGEDGMATALRNDLGDDVSHEQGSAAGQGLFDAYIVQAPWLWPVVNGLENLTPRIRENADTVKFLDINPASRSAVSYNGTVRALPLDTDYIALGWRQDVFHRYNVSAERSPPRTIEDLASLAEELNGLDFNEDGEPDWGICLTPQVNYFYAFVAPMMQTSLRDPVDNTPTGQNMFFSTDAFEPLIHQPAFKTAVETYYKIIRNSNCGEQLSRGEKCDRKTAFPSGRCAMVISMPGTLTKMLLDGAKYAPVPRTNETSGEVQWDINNMPLGTEGTYWGRRAPFPGSTVVQEWNEEAGYPLVECAAEEEQSCPLADENGINFAPFFAEGGEAYAINGRQSSPAAKTVMWDFFTWLSEIPASELPLSGQYRLSHLNEEHREELTEQAGWPNQMVDDIFNVLGQYFKSEENGGNPVQDLLMLGFPEYMGALDDELHDTFLGVKKDSPGGVFNWEDPQQSIGPSSDGSKFDRAYENFIESLEAKYSAISASISGGRMGQLQRWRSSLNLPWRTEEELCVAVLAANKLDSFNGLQCSFYVSFEALCQTDPDAVANIDDALCDSFKEGPNLAVIIPSIVIPLIVLAVLGGYCYGQMKKRKAESRWKIKLKDLEFDDPPEVIGRGRFGEVVLATYRGTRVAVKTCKIAPAEGTPKMTAKDAPGVKDEEAGDVSEVSFSHRPLDGGQEISTSTSTDRKVKSEGMSSFGSLGLLELTKSIMNSKSSSPRDKFIKEIRMLTNLQDHRNIVGVMGAVIQGTKEPRLVLEYMERGSLCDYLRRNEQLGGKLILNILSDVAQGLLFLHSSDPVVVHSDLKSSNILIDDRFRAKVSDFGWGNTGTPYWTAPEVLRRETPYTTQSDVYAFGITVFEIYSREYPYEDEDMDTVLEELMDPVLEKRPLVPATMSSVMQNMMKDCWAAQPHHRPTLSEIVARIGRLTIQDVEYQTESSESERALLFPSHVEKELDLGDTVETQTHDNVSVVYIEIVGFERLYRELSPDKFADLIQRLNDGLDEIADRHAVFEAETMGGAAWMGATNCVRHQPDHVARITRFALEAVQSAGSIFIDEEDPSTGTVQLRTALISGEVRGKVVGFRRKRYSLSGPAVNAAQYLAREHGAPGNILCSDVEQVILERDAPTVATAKHSALSIPGMIVHSALWINPTTVALGKAKEEEAAEAKAEEEDDDDDARMVDQLVQDLDQFVAKSTSKLDTLLFDESMRQEMKDESKQNKSA